VCRFGESRDGMNNRDATLILAANKTEWFEHDGADFNGSSLSWVN